MPICEREGDGVSVSPQDDQRRVTDPLHIYADGSFDAASRSGGWAFVVMADDRPIHTVSATLSVLSNNTFEVLSVIKSVSWLEREVPSAAAVIWTDSTHVVEGCDRWRPIWRGNGWKRVRVNSHERRRPIPDADQWQELDALLKRNPQVEVQLCKGHSGIHFNEMADPAARAVLPISGGAIFPLRDQNGLIRNAPVLCRPAE